MDKIIYYILILLVILVGIIVFKNNKPEGYQKMSPEEARLRLQKEKDIILLDVRTVEEHEEKHIDGSTLIPLDVLFREVHNTIPNKETTVIVYCRSGNRSKTAVHGLLTLGYKNVYDLGGIISWPYETK